jgi:hypothetical protein
MHSKLDESRFNGYLVNISNSFNTTTFSYSTFISILPLAGNKDIGFTKYYCTNIQILLFPFSLTLSNYGSTFFLRNFSQTH